MMWYRKDSVTELIHLRKPLLKSNLEVIMKNNFLGSYLKNNSSKSKCRNNHNLELQKFADKLLKLPIPLTSTRTYFCSHRFLLIQRGKLAMFFIYRRWLKTATAYIHICKRWNNKRKLSLDTLSLPLFFQMKIIIFNSLSPILRYYKDFTISLF